MEKLRKIYLLLTILFIGIILPTSPLMAQLLPDQPKVNLPGWNNQPTITPSWGNGGNGGTGGNTNQKDMSSCSTSCDQALDSCRPQLTSAKSSHGDQMIAGSSSAKMDINCLKENSKNSCFNSVPVDGGSGNYNAVGTRASGRNHYGTDIGGGGKTNIHAFPVAEGDVAMYNQYSTGSGRTFVINHKLKCQSTKYKGYYSVYRHFYKVSTKVSGQQHVNPGDELGIVGGSNYVKPGKPNCAYAGKFCDHPAQNNTGCPNGGTTGCGHYDIHLHLELFEGVFSSSSTYAKTDNLLQPYCQNASALCGECPADKKACPCKGSCGGAWGGASAGQGDYAEDTGGAYAASTCSLEKYLNSDDCMFCPIFRSFFNAASASAKTANDKLAVPSKGLVSVGFLIWLCLYVLKHITNFGGTSTGDMLKGILYQGFRVAVVLLILSNAIYATMDLTLNPVMQTGLSFVNNLSETSKCDDGAAYMQGIMGYKSGSNDGNGGLSIDLGKSIMCSIKKLEDATGFMMGLGKYSICLSWYTYDWLFGLLPHFGYLLTGCFLWLAGVFVLLTFPWCLVDCMLQLCIAAALVPCAIASYAFRITEKYLKIVWNFFMNAMFNFVFLGIIIYIINSHLKDWIGMEIDDTSTFNDHVFIEGFTARGLAVWGIGFLKVAAICFFCNTFLEEAGDMAKKFAESPGLGGRNGIGRMVGGTMGNLGQVAGGGALKLTAKGGVALGKGVGNMTNSLVGNKFRSGMNHLKGRAIGLLPKGKKIVDADGKTVGYERNIRFMGRNISRSYRKDENGVWTGEKIVKKRSSADKAFEQVFDKNGNALKDANGNNVYRYRKRIFGITTGYEEMTATSGADGNLVYQSKSGKGRFSMDQNGNFQEYKTRFTMNLNNLSTRKMSKVYDKNGYAVKDANGNDQYEIKHQFLGMTFKKEKMEAQKDASGNIIKDNEGNIMYATADNRNSFVMDKKHQMSNVIIDKPSRVRRGDKQVKNYNAKRVINDAFSKTTQTLDNNGNVISAETHFSNVSAKYLNNKDGTINKMAFNQIKNGTQNAEVAAAAMVSEVMRFRGQKLDNAFKSRTQEIQEDGSIIIKQINNDGSKQVIHAQVINDQMIIRNTVTDENGNTTIQKSNGMQTLTEKYTRVVDEASGQSAYIYQSRLDFSDNLHQKNSHSGPLNAHGEWGHNLDPQKVMLGFTDNDFKKHSAQVKLAQMRKMMGEQQYLAALEDKNSQVYQLSTLLNAGDINTQSRLRQLRNKMGAEKYNKALKDKSSEVYQLKQQLVKNSLSESAARIHAGQAMVGGLAVQLENVETMLANKEAKMTAINEGKQKASQVEKAALQNEINNLKKVQTDLKQAMGTDERATQPQPQTQTQVQPQTQPQRSMNYEAMIDEIANNRVTPKTLVEMNQQLQDTAYGDRNQDYAFVYGELHKKANDTITELAAGSLAGATAEDLNNMERMLDTFVSHTTDRNGVKTYQKLNESDVSAEVSNGLMEKIEKQRQVLGIVRTRPAPEQRAEGQPQPTTDTRERATGATQPMPSGTTQPTTAETATEERPTGATPQPTTTGTTTEDRTTGATQQPTTSDTRERTTGTTQQPTTTETATEERTTAATQSRPTAQTRPNEQPQSDARDTGTPQPATSQAVEDQAAERAAQEAKQREEQERAAQEAKQKEAQERAAQEAQAREEQEKAEQEASQRVAQNKEDARSAEIKSDDREQSGARAHAAGESGRVVGEHYHVAASEQLAVEHFHTAAASEQLAVEHYQEAAKYEEIAENERREAAAGGIDAQTHIDSAMEAERNAELERQAAIEADQRAQEEYQKAMQDIDALTQEPQVETERVEEREQEPQQVEAERPEEREQELQQVEAERVEEREQEPQQVEAERPEEREQEPQQVEAERTEEREQEPQQVEAERTEEREQEPQQVEAERVEEREQEPQQVEAERPEELAQGSQFDEQARQQAEQEQQARATEDARFEEQRKAEEQAIADRKLAAQRLRNEQIKESLSLMKSQIAKPQDRLKTVEYQIGNVRAQLSTAKSAMEVAGLTPTEKRDRTKTYNDILSRYNQLRSERKEAVSAITAAVNAHNERVSQIKKG